MKLFDEFNIYVTVTGFSHYPNAKRLLEGDRVTLYRETENEFDNSAISVYSEFGKVGYIANSVKTMRSDTMSASRLSELIKDTATAIVTEGGYYEAICKVIDIYDADKMILKACGLYDEGEYSKALPLFLKICESFNSIMLLQYTTDCLIKTGEYKVALDFAQRTIELEKDNKVSMMMYATILDELERYDEAIEWYNKILALGENKIVEKALNGCLSKNEKI